VPSPSRGERPDDLRRLREHRTPRERDLTIGATVHQLERETRKRVKATGGIGAAWEALVPPGLRSRAVVVSLSRGVLTVRAADASARFGLDRFLRSGGQAALARQAGVGIKRSKIVG
jgi:hypothetical protein